MLKGEVPLAGVRKLQIVCQYLVLVLPVCCAGALFTT
jgi:hypothetical protein